MPTDPTRSLIKVISFGLRRSLLLLAILLTQFACTSKAELVESETAIEAAPLDAVVALGRLVPEGEVIKVSVSNAQDSRVNKLFVSEGDRVEENQVIALLQGVERREADVRNAQTEVRLRQAELDRVLQGDAKLAEIQAQQAEIEELEARLRTEQQQREAAIASAEAVVREAELTIERRQSLVEEGAISVANLNQAERDLDTAKATLLERQAALQQTRSTLEASIRQARANLTALEEVRPVDIEIARARLDQAKIEVEQRQADLEDVRVRAPASGQILRINTRVGEQVNTAQGIVELARTQQMFAIAEVYESDIDRVTLGQMATMRTDYGGFEGELQGVVESMGLQVGRRTLQEEGGGGPSLDREARVVEVKVRLSSQDSQKVARYTNMLVQVSIDTDSASANRLERDRSEANTVSEF